jgi:hypothetical protein
LFNDVYAELNSEETGGFSMSMCRLMTVMWRREVYEPLAEKIHKSCARSIASFRASLLATDADATPDKPPHPALDREDEIAVIIRATESIQDLSANEANMRLLTHTSAPIDGPYAEFHEQLIDATRVFYEEVLASRSMPSACRAIDADERLLRRIALPMT